MNKDWLHNIVTAQEWKELGKQNLYPVRGDDYLTIPNGTLPFGEQYFTYRKMLFYAEVDPKSVIWHFRSSDASWSQLAGREGYIMARDNVFCDGLSITTRMS
jgi:hypothetical protein